MSLGFAYDGSLRTLESVTGAVSGNISRSYDADFRTTGLAVNGDNNLSFAYDPDSLLIEAGDLGCKRPAAPPGTAIDSRADCASFHCEE